MASIICQREHDLGLASGEPVGDPPRGLGGLEHPGHPEGVACGEIGAHEPGADRRHRDAERQQVDAQRLQQVDLGRLGGAVRLRAREAAVAGDAGHAHDAAGPRPAHVRQHRLDAVDHPHQVHLDVAAEDVGIPGGHVHAAVRRRVQDCDVDPAQLVPDRGGRGQHRRAVADVQRHRHHPVALRLLFEPLGAAGADRDPAPRAASSAASASPMPLDAPVIQTRLPPSFTGAPAPAGRRRSRRAGSRPRSRPGRTPTCGGTCRRSRGRAPPRARPGTARARRAASRRSGGRSRWPTVTRSREPRSSAARSPAPTGSARPGRCTCGPTCSCGATPGSARAGIVIVCSAIRPPGASSRSQTAKYVGPVLLAHRLEHLDRDDPVEAAVQLAVVAEQDLDPVARGRPRARAARASSLCSAGDGDGGDPAAAGGGRVDRHAAPAGADLEHVVARADAGQVAASGRTSAAARRPASRPARTRRRSRSWSRPGTARTARSTGRSGGRCWRGAGGRVPLACAARSGSYDAAQPLQRPRHQLRQPLGERRQHPGQVVGVPLAGHVGLAEADLAGAAEAVEEGVRPDLHARRARLPAQRLPVRARSPPAARSPAAERVRTAARAIRARAGRRGGGGIVERGHPTPPCGVWSGRRTRGTPRSHSLTPL